MPQSSGGCKNQCLRVYGIGERHRRSRALDLNEVIKAGSDKPCDSPPGAPSFRWLPCQYVVFRKLSMHEFDFLNQ
eukprot:scaffold383831_cov44-Prasinocladus_malaysianus.AAC.2